MTQRDDNSSTGEPATRRRYTFSKRMRLTHRDEFKAVYGRRVRHFIGPLRVYAIPNGRDHPRLGLSVARAVGNAVRRGRIKRRLREAFRHLQHDLPAGYDVAISVKPHGPLSVAEYQRLLFKALRNLHGTWSTRPDNPSGTESDGAPDS